MKCPHCNEETPLSADKCVHCGLSLQFTAGTLFDRPERGEAVESDWGPRLVRPAVLLAVVAALLWYGGRSFRTVPKVAFTVEEPQVTAPGLKVALPAPKLPGELPAPKLIQPEAIALPEPLPAPHARPAFGSRDPRVRRLFLERNGGDAHTEAAVKLGLEWLSRIQSDDGAWEYSKFGVDEKFRGAQDYRVGISGLALLAFLGAGHNHQDAGPFKDTVAKALRYLVGVQGKDGQFPGQLYHQGICTMALVEAYGLTGDTTLLQAAQQGIQAIVSAQGMSGGWDYGFGGGRGDTSVSGWQVMAIKSAKRVGIEFPPAVYEKALGYLGLVTREDGAVGYESGGRGTWRTTAAMTAVGMNALLFMNVEAPDARVQKAMGIILRDLPGTPRQFGTAWKPQADIYYWYHGQLAMSRLGGPEWKVWNDRTKEVLLGMQDKEGDWKGSWRLGGDPWSDRAGRVYFTALAIMALEVYYRYD